MGTLESSISSEILTPIKERSNLSLSLKRKRPPKIDIPNVLKEISIDTQFKFGCSPVKNDGFFVFEDLGVGVYSIKGKKKFMEDTHKVVSSIDGNSKKGFFGVYDGHGGRKAAEFVAESLHNNILEMLGNCAGNIAKEDAVKAAYLKTDKEFLEKGVGSGACCVSVLIEGTEMIVSNLGDSRAVLCRDGVAEPLTKDHKAEMVEERKRIEDKGGYVEFHKGAWRVHGILAISRSIGDSHLKNWVVSEPDTTILNLTLDMDFLILASDGLWDEVGNQEAIDIVLRSCVIKKKPELPLYLNNTSINQRSLLENDDEYDCIKSGSSPKVKRVSLIRTKKKTTLSPSCKKIQSASTLEDSLLEIDSEPESPPAKLRRTSLFTHKSLISSPRKENTKPTSEGLVVACKKLADLVASSGCMDGKSLNSFPRKENTKPTSEGLVIASKKLSNSGSTDDKGLNPSPLEENTRPTSEGLVVASKKLANSGSIDDKGLNPSPLKEDMRPTSEGLAAACRKLANLAASRGSMDDITVMLIDLNHFRSGPCKGQQM